MAISKAEAIKQGSVADQQALVQLLTNNTVKPIKRVIPGGRTMLKSLDQKTLERAVYNWLRGTHHFEQVTISLAKDPNLYRTKEQKVVDFPEEGQHPIWVTHKEGKRYLARLMADILKKNKLVYLLAKKEGLFLATDTERKFSPLRKATKADVEAAVEATGEEDVGFGIGDSIANENWEPYVEFIPQRRAQYGR